MRIIPILFLLTSCSIILCGSQSHSDLDLSGRYYPYAVKGFVQDVRLQPLRFIGSLFFKKAFILLKLKLKWKLKKKIILKKLLKKFFHHGRKRRDATFSFPRDEAHVTELDRRDLLNEPHYNQHQRDYDEYAQHFPEDQEPKDSDIMKYLAMASEFDTNGCIPKGICEVMAQGNRTTNQFGNNILDYYNDDSYEREDSTGTPAHIYDYAAFVGKTQPRNGRGRSCVSYFPKCPDPPQQLNTFMNEVFVSEMCDAPIQNLH